MTTDTKALIARLRDTNIIPTTIECSTAADALAAQSVRIAELERDATRYRTIRSEDCTRSLPHAYAPYDFRPIFGEELDAVIDAYIAAQAGSKEPR
jgi:hypothetical protein